MWLTKLLQTQRKDSQCRMQDFVYGGAFRHFMSPQGRRSGGITSREILELSRVAIAVEKLPPPSGKNATRRRVSRIMLASVVNASSRRRRRGLPRSYCRCRYLVVLTYSTYNEKKISCFWFRSGTLLQIRISIKWINVNYYDIAICNRKVWVCHHAAVLSINCIVTVQQYCCSCTCTKTLSTYSRCHKFTRQYSS